MKDFLRNADYIRELAKKQKLQEEGAFKAKKKQDQRRRKEAFLRYQQHLQAYGSNTGTAAASGFTNTYSAKFDGDVADSTIGFGDNMVISPSSSFSISTWVKHDSNPGESGVRIASKVASGRGVEYKGLSLTVDSFSGVKVLIQGREPVTNNPKGLTVRSAVHSGSDNAGGGNIIPNASLGWYHLVVTYNGNFSSSGMDIYVNGISRVSQSSNGTHAESFDTSNMTPGSSTNDTTPFHIGSRNGASDFMNGNIDEFVYFTGSLAQSDVSNLYNSGVPTDATSIDYSNQFIAIQHYYRMGDNDGGTGTTVTDQVGSVNGTLTGEGIVFEEDVPG